MVTVKDYVVSCIECGVTLNVSAFDSAQAVYHWDRVHSCKPVAPNVEATLEMLNKHNVGQATFDGRGQLINVVFKPTPLNYGVGNTVKSVSAQNMFGVDRSPQEQPAHKETDIELIRNPPRDILYPVDDGAPEE